ncbi:triple tyrosine motif-containing protein [Marinoscillum furvescens]|uniref:YXYXY domain-containing protein n=1 Tax=Marinoscillum furvescens DSM 4134 TaxID=1122208 RepID=A0A3D9L5W0_MARFU|nr:triple tyrosine motif-containing protein [Marinoscillum furvescens]RED99812.1 YXYXY domain-containing protein [Marinoscillum furvescens DSM 4134]
MKGVLVRLFAGVFLLLHAGFVGSQSKNEIKGTPRIIHYTKNEFQADPQIWSMAQDDSGVLYFGNNDGTLIYDGAQWQKIALPNNSSVRSICYSSEGKLYVGGFNDFGIIAKDEFGDYHYHSLLDKLPPAERTLENIWAIHEVQGHIVMRSLSKLIAIKDDKVFTIPAFGYYYSNVVNDQLLLANPSGLQLLDLNSLEFEVLTVSETYSQQTIASVLPGAAADELYLFTKPGGIYAYQNGKCALIRNCFAPGESNQILSAIKSIGGNYYLGTLSTQLMVLNEQAENLSLSAALTRLQNNTVLNLFESAEGNIWALLNNGIDCINISSPVSVLFENASVYDVLIRGGKIYAATNQGVFVSERIVHNPHFSSLAFEKIPGLEGQAWKLDVVGENILCSHDAGVYVINEADQAKKLTGSQGTWKILKVDGYENTYFLCTYIGLTLLTYESGKYIIHGPVEGLVESTRDIIQGNQPGEFWICHGYKGVFRVRLSKNLKQTVAIEHFRESGLPSPLSVNTFRYDGQIVFTTNEGIFTFDEKANRFVPHEELNKRFGTDKNVRKLLEEGNLTWFVHDDEAGYFLKDQEGLNKDLFLELKGTFNRSMECILPVNDNNVLLGATNGLYAYDLSFEQQKPTGEVLLTQVAFWNTGEKEKLSLLDPRPKLPHHASNITFCFAAPKLKDQTKVQYSYLLKGMDKAWSAWTPKPSKEYTTLPPGNYTFQVKARSIIGESTSQSSYDFVIIPVWYQTKGAYLIYLIIIVCGAYASRKLIKRKIFKEKEKTRSEEQEKQSILEMELEQMRLEREKERIERDKKQLEEDVIFKSKELANYTMLLVRKRELLTELREDLKELKEVAKNEKSRNRLRQLIRKIGINLNDEEHIQVFEANFERVHHEFFKELKMHFPDLTLKELRLCALVKMNLSNKEIAPILNISVRGVETARYRLRKRLSLDHEENMVEFLEKLAP